MLISLFRSRPSVLFRLLRALRSLTCVQVVRALAVHPNELSQAPALAVPRLPLLSRASARVLAVSPLTLFMNPPAPKRDIPALTPIPTSAAGVAAPMINSVADLHVGMLVDAVVRDVFQTHIVAVIGTSL